MQLDQMVLKRFDELEARAKEVDRTVQVTDIAAAVDSRKFQEWATAALNLLQRVCGEKSVHFRNFSAIHSKIISIAYKETFDNCRAIVRAARDDYENGYLFELRGMLGEEIIYFLLERAFEFQERGNKDAACILAGVALENSLKHLCKRKGILRGKCEQMNTDLCRGGGYDARVKEEIAGWLALQQHALGGEWDRYGEGSVGGMLDGLERFIKEQVAV